MNILVFDSYTSDVQVLLEKFVVDKLGILERGKQKFVEITTGFYRNDESFLERYSETKVAK